MWKYYLISCSHQDHISPRRNIIPIILKDFPLCSALDCLYNNDFLTFKLPPCCVFEPLIPYRELTTDSSQMNNSSFNRKFRFMQFDNQIHQHEDVTFDSPRLSRVCD